jgi:hypothetical protein
MIVKNLHKNPFFITAYILGAFWIGKQLVRGLDLFGLATVLAIVSPLIIFAVIKSKPLWIAIVLGLIPATFTIPIVIFDRLQLAAIFCVMVIAIGILDRIIYKSGRYPVANTLEAMCLLLTAVIVFLRFLYDQPGSSRMGNVGGGREAFYFVIAMFAFIFFSRVASEDWNARYNLKMLLWLVSCVFCYDLISSLIENGLYKSLLHLFGGSLWILSSFFLAWNYEKLRRMGKITFDYRIILAIFLVVMAGLSSPFRSRPLFALGIVVSISYVYGFLRRSTMAVFVFLFLGLTILSFYGPQVLPASVLRSITTVVTFEQEDFSNYYGEYETGVEVGWRSGFRKKMFNMAMEDIKENPILGSGFAFSRVQMANSLMSPEGDTSTLAMSGGYHNSLLELGAICGLPAMFLFSIGFLVIFIKFVRSVKTVEDPDLRFFSAGLLGVFVANSGQMLFNGGGTELFYVCVILGVMNGIIHRIRLLNKTITAPVTAHIDG